MNSITATSKYPDIKPLPEEDAVRLAIRNPIVRFNGISVITLVSLVLALATASECRSITYFPSLVYGFVLWGWWGCVATTLWLRGKKGSVAWDFSLTGISVHLVVGSILGILHLLLLWSLGFTALGWQGNETPETVWRALVNINRFGIELLTYGFILGGASIVQYQIRAQRDAMRALELQRQLSAAQLQALQMQLEPHFLFNTLNAITTLVELGRQTEATEMLSHLNAILKSTLKRNTPEKVPLSQELQIVENYLAIEQVRFADRLQIEIKVEPSALEGLVPCFLLQPIIENAIRHGISQCEDEGLVQAYAKRDGNSLLLRIRDTGPGAAEPSRSGHGIGLSNTRERLTHFYQNEFSMKAEPMTTGGFEVAITIPYERIEG